MLSLSHEFFCGPYCKYLKVESFPCSQYNIFFFIQHHFFITIFEVSKTVMSVNRFLLSSLITFAGVLNVLSRNLQQISTIYRAETVWGLSEVQWLNSGTGNDLQKITEMQRNLSILHGGCLKVLQTMLNPILQYVFNHQSDFDTKWCESVASCNSELGSFELGRQSSS